MSIYHNFIGIDIDIGKYEVVVNLFTEKKTLTFTNNSQGFQAFIQAYQPHLKKGLVVLENTGGYEQYFVNQLLKLQIPVHKANTRLLKHFIRSWGQKGKSDAIDAKALANYAKQRHHDLKTYQAPSQKAQTLAALTQRKKDLNSSLVQEKNRLQAPQNEPLVKTSIQQSIQHLQKQLKTIQNEIQKIIEQDPLYQKQKKVLCSIKGIGPVVSSTIIAFIPEIGQLNRRQIASLCGLAPYPYESGKYQGYRKTQGGRKNVKTILFMAAMTAARSKGILGDFYLKMIKNGKKKMVAITALMRKIIVIANAKIKQECYS
jgi:transposase